MRSPPLPRSTAPSTVVPLITVLVSFPVCTGALILRAPRLLDCRAAPTRRHSFAGVARPLAFNGGRQKRPAHPLCRRHFIETTARPFFPHPRQRTRSLRSSTLV